MMVEKILLIKNAIHIADDIKVLTAIIVIVTSVATKATIFICAPRRQVKGSTLAIGSEVTLKGLPDAFQMLLEGQARGRTVVKLG